MTRQQHHKVYSVKDLTNLILEEIWQSHNKRKPNSHCIITAHNNMRYSVKLRDHTASQIAELIVQSV